MPLTSSQIAAVAARGNVIVVAGAGTGKTSTLVQRCFDVIREDSSLDKVLMVTFTEAAAAEMRHRLRLELQKLAETSDDLAKAGWYAEQLALVETAKISTIHSFCLRLVQSHFHELGLDPEVKVLDDQQCRLLTQETLDTLMEECFAGGLPISEAVRALIAAYAPDRDGMVRELVLRLHRYTQSLSDAAGWIKQQQEVLAAESSGQWENWLVEAFRAWREQWRSALEPQFSVKNLKDCHTALDAAGNEPDRSSIRQAAESILAADAADWNKLKTKMRKPFSKFFDEAGFLASVAAEGALETDWQAVRGHLGALLALTAEFTARFTAAKRELGGLDFPDLEQLTLRLLLKEDGSPTDVAKEWQDRMDFVFVDECQDINGAQDAILSAVSREGGDANRFLVGDVKQSIYQFRLADPQIFRRYEGSFMGGEGQRILLSENFRSRPGILNFVNAFFSRLMRESFGGVSYEALQAGEGSHMADLDEGPCVELHLIRKASATKPTSADDADGDAADLSATEREARLVAARLRELKRSGFSIWDKETGGERPVEWRDMAVLMRSPGTRTEAFAKVFHEAGIPLAASRGGFLAAIEVSDLVSLLRLLDNPLQDIPLLAVLRSPLVGLSLDELALIRVHSDAQPFWRALREFAPEGGDSFPRVPDQRDAGIGGTVKRVPTGPLLTRVAAFLGQFERWRVLVRQVGPAACLEQVLAETSYEVLLGANERGAEQAANVRQLLDLARQFDPYLRQGLYRFLKFLKALDDAGDSLEPAPVPVRDAVQLMSIHKSKGLEFPVVALAGLGSRFNLRELNDLLLLDSEFGLAPKAVTASGAARYPTLPFWLAERHQRTQWLGEELRLCYVATTRARDRLICTGMLTCKDQGRWPSQSDGAVSDRQLLTARSPVDWLLAWLPKVTQEAQWHDDNSGVSDLMTWELWDAQDERLGSLNRAHDFSRLSGSASPVDPSAVTAVAERLHRIYAHDAAKAEPAKSSVSVLRRRAVELADEEALNRFAGRVPRVRLGIESDKFSAAERGTLNHRFLQHLEIANANSASALSEQAWALVQRGVFSDGEAGALDLEAIAAFWSSPVGRQISAESAHVRRELPFTARFDDEEVRFVLGQAPDASLVGEFVVVQGVVDLAVVLDGEIWILDFKTDAVRDAQVAARAEEYRPQLQLYASALDRIHGKPVRHLWLHFLAAGNTVEVGPVADGG